jgi:Mg-chelatase subunit ChlD
MNEVERMRRWRLVLGRAAEHGESKFLVDEDQRMDRALEALYDSDRAGGLGSSSPNVSRWLGDIRRFFPTPAVQLLQKDALERIGLQRMLLEPELLETIEPSAELVGVLLTLKKLLPDRTRETARMVVRRVVEAIEKQLRLPLEQAVKGVLRRGAPNRRPRHREIDWSRTIRANLRYYQPDYQSIIPVHLFGYQRSRARLRHILLCIDQSGSMAGSVVYAGVLACVLASLPGLRTDLIAFDTNVVDLSKELSDPVDLLFATQLGGGTRIAPALAYARQLIAQPSDALVFLLSDLYEGEDPEEALRQAGAIQAAGARCIVLLALDDQGAPTFNHELAYQLAALGIPAFACTPDQFPPLLAAAIHGDDFSQLFNEKLVLKN